MNVTVVGAGAWGTSLARLLVRNGHSVTLWARNPALLESISSKHCNEQFLPGIALPEELRCESCLRRALEGTDMAVLAVPSQGLRGVSSQSGDYKGILVSVTKGIEHTTGLTMSGILAETSPGARVACLSGPSFAMEVARDIPTAVVVASRDELAARAVQEAFVTPCFRVYTGTDVLGVELGGALKNVIAIAAGLSDGLGFGDNSKAALVTRAIVEIKRLAVACGAQADTPNGLSGIGDLVVTCFSKLSRNRGFGERMARGETPDQIVRSMEAVAEGYPTARSAFELSRKKEISTPILDEVHAMLYEGKDITSAVRDLMTRDPKPEV